MVVMDEQMKLFGADVLPMPVSEPSKPTRAPYDVASDLVADYAVRAGLRYRDEVDLRSVLLGFVDGVVGLLELNAQQREYLRNEAWTRADEASRKRDAEQN